MHMKRHVLLFFTVLAVIFPCAPAWSQINAGPDVTICSPGSTTLTATLPPSMTGTSVSLTDDQYTGVINIGFPFTFFGNTYTQCVISSNNYITFNLAAANGFSPWSINNPIPSAANPTNTIMCPWQDLLPPSGGTITYATMGTAPNRVFVIAFCSVAMFSCTNLQFTSQIQLYETTNIIETHIANKPVCTSWNNGRAIHGIQNNAGSIAFVVPGRNFPTQWTATNDGYRFTPTGINTYTVGPIPYAPVILSSTTNPIQWYIGATLVGTGPSITVSPTTTTTYTATVSGGCIGSSSDQVVVTVTTLTVAAGPDQSICAGNCATLTGNAAGATSYSWQIYPSGVNVGNTQTISVCPTGTAIYIVTATAPNCTGTDTVVVFVTQMTTASAGPDDTVCAGSCTTLQGSGGVTYSWAPTASITGPANIANPQACPTVTTQYTVTVTDANGCIGYDSAIVYVASQPLTVNITSTDVSCFSACNGTATANASGGYTPYTYAWSNATTNQVATGLCAGNYNVTVTDAIGCTATANVTISEPTALLVQATNISTANCGQNDGSVTISISGGTPFTGNVYTILWPASGGSGLTENNLPAGNVCVYVYDANGCGDTLCVNVPNTPGAVVNISSSTNVTCNGACDGTAIAVAAGGTAPYTFVWNTSPSQTADTATGICPGTYTVVMTDDNGCTDSSTVTITEPPALTLAAGTSQTICIGQTANLTAGANGGTPGYQYFWTDGTNNWTTQNISVSPTVTTVYTVYSVDANNCISPSQTVTVTVSPPLTVQAMPAITVCANTPVTLTAAGGGGNGVYTYSWLPLNQTGQSVNTTVVSTTTYTVIITDGCNTPPDSSTVTVTVNPNPVVNISATTATTGCEPLCVTFINNTPNTGSIEWTFGSSLGTSSLANPTFCFTTAGTYDVSATVTDNIGCVGSTTLLNYVTVWPLPTAAFSALPQPATALNNIVTFTDLSTGASSWIWSFGDDDSASVLQNPTYAFQDTGIFNVQLIVTNQYGCQDMVTMPIVVQEDYALFIPNTFTPNGDGQNDLFFPQGIGANPDNFTMYIFDRWGNLIYQTTAWPGGWDGTVQGTSRLCQVDTYVYKITTMDPDGLRKVYVGHINLLR